MLRRIFGPKEEESGRSLQKEELHNLYTSQNIIRVTKSRIMKRTGRVARMGETRSAYKILVGKPEGKRPFGRPRCTWGDNIRMGLRDIR
jgi:hypothetical protein